jgi:hypothetical protein
VATPCAPWQSVRGPVRKCGCVRPFNRIVRRHVRTSQSLVAVLITTAACSSSAEPSKLDERWTFWDSRIKAALQ